jgi:uncharacterized membrane protein
MNNCKKYYTWLMALTAAAFIITAVCIQFMADSVPMHYNFHGEIDRYGSKNENFIFPCFIAVFNIFWVIFMNVFGRRADRAQEEKARVEAAGNLKVLGFTAIGTTIMFIIIQFVMLLVDINASEGQDRMPIDINVISNCCLGLIFIVIGNIIPKCKRNGVVGVRTTWSMDNDTTWELSNRLGGRLMMVCGVLTIIETIVVKGFASTVIMLVLIIAMSALMIYYSYVFYKKYGNNAKKHQ